MLIDGYSQRILVSDVQHNLSRFELSIHITPKTYLEGIYAKGEFMGLKKYNMGVQMNIIVFPTQLLPSFQVISTEYHLKINSFDNYILSK